MSITTPFKVQISNCKCFDLADGIRVILELNMTFSQELVSLHTTPSRIRKFLVHAWR